MKRIIGVGLSLVMVLLFLVSCGVPQEKYDKLNSDLTAAQTQIQSLQSDLSAKESELTAAETQAQSLQSNLSAKESELSAAKTQAQSLQSSLSAKESELQATKTKLAQAKSRMEVVNGLFIPAITGELDKMTQAQATLFFLGWMVKS